MPIATKLDEFGKPAWILLLVLGLIWWPPLGLAIFAFMIGTGRMGWWDYNGVRRWRDRASARSSGNRAFDEYRADTLRRLEEEQREFKEFLQRLRFAKDRAEFDQFMAERRGGPGDAAPQSQSQPSGLRLIAPSSPAAPH